MLIYENLTDTLIRVRIEPQVYAQCGGGKGFNNENSKSILLNYFIPDAEMSVYIDLTDENPDAFYETRRYRLPSEKWVYCKKGKKIEQCREFRSLEIIRKESNITYYTRITPKKSETFSDGLLELATFDDGSEIRNSSSF